VVAPVIAFTGSGAGAASKSFFCLCSFARLVICFLLKKQICAPNFDVRLPRCMISIDQMPTIPKEKRKKYVMQLLGFVLSGDLIEC
jgi:hypothetical protein